MKEGKREKMKDKDAAEARGLRQEDSQHSVEVEEQSVYRWKIQSRLATGDREGED